MEQTTPTHFEECPPGEHDYECTYEGWEMERYRCTKCGHSYALYEDEMR